MKSTPGSPAADAAFPVPAAGNRALTADELSDRLRARGLRVTGPRLIVYRAIVTEGGHRSADDVSAAIAAAGPALPRTSVYNALKALVDAGIIDVVDAGPGTALYEVRGENHHHFLCRSCGALIDVPSDAALDGGLRAEMPGAVVESAQVILRGVCRGCVAQAAQHA